MGRWVGGWVGVRLSGQVVLAANTTGNESMKTHIWQYEDVRCIVV